MWGRIKAFFNLGKICDIVTSVRKALAAAVEVLNFVRKEVEGSPLGEKIVPVLNTINDGIAIIKRGLDFVASLIGCGEVVEVSAASANLDESLKKFNGALDNLKKLSK